MSELEPAVKRIILETLTAERKQLHLDRPQGVKANIKEVIELKPRSSPGGSLVKRSERLTLFNFVSTRVSTHSSLDRQGQERYRRYRRERRGKDGPFYALNWVLYGDAGALPGVLIKGLPWWRTTNRERG